MEIRYGLNASDRDRSAGFLQADVDDLTDATTLVFPAIGVALMLLFGGVLLTTALRCRLSDSTVERKEEKYSRKITFYNAPSKLRPKGKSVLQQENNDIVDAVMREYGELSHFQPERDHNGNFQAPVTLTFSRPEMVDRGMDPICGDMDYAHSNSPGSNSRLQVVLNQGKDSIDQNDGPAGTSIQTDDLCSVELDVRSQCSFEVDSLERSLLYQHNMKRGSAEKEFRIGGSGPAAALPPCEPFDGQSAQCSASTLNQQAAQSSLVARREPLREKRIGSDYSQGEIRWSLLRSDSGSSIGCTGPWLERARNTKSTNRGSQKSIGVCNSLTRENIRRCNDSGPECKRTLEKWLSDVQAFYPHHDYCAETRRSDSDSSTPGATPEISWQFGPDVERECERKVRWWRRMRTKSLVQSAAEDLGVRTHSLAPLCHSSDSHVDAPCSARGSEGTPEIGGQGRPQPLESNYVTGAQRDSNECHVGQCHGSGALRYSRETPETLSVTRPDRSHVFHESSLRGASCFGGTKVLIAQPESEACCLRGASSLGAHGAADSTLKITQRVWESEKLNADSSFRGASSFGSQRHPSCPAVGTHELRGASVFGSSQVIEQGFKRKPSRTEPAVDSGNETVKSEINAPSKFRSVSSLKQWTSSITLNLSQGSDSDHSQCERESLASPQSCKNTSRLLLGNYGHGIVGEQNQEGKSELDPPSDPERNVEGRTAKDAASTSCRTWHVGSRRATCRTAQTCDERAALQPGTTKLSASSILNVGRDVSVMSALLCALRHETGIRKDRRKA